MTEPKSMVPYSSSSQRSIAVPHREITIIELQSLVVFDCTALIFMVGATAITHDREEGWEKFLFVYTE